MIWSAFILGFLGSMHCAGMCGPIALSIRTHSVNASSFLLSRLIYNAGRVITYSLLGAIAGSFGAVISLAGFQQGLSIGLGIILLLTALVLFPGFKTHAGFFIQPISKKVSSALSSMITSVQSKHLIVIGLLNGLLPCGLVYTALAAAATGGTIGSGALYMMLFGAGTLPMMLAISLSGKIIPVAWRSRITRIYPYITALIAILLILRGMNLGIPMLSPEISNGAEACCHK